MITRNYTDADWDRVREIYDFAKPDEMGDAVDPSALRPLANDPGMLELFRASEIIVAIDDEEVIGFGGFKGSYISWLFVHPDHRRRGVARALLAAMLARLEGPVRLNVLRSNVAAIKLYEEFGFTVIKDFVGRFNGQEVNVLTLSSGKRQATTD